MARSKLEMIFKNQLDKKTTISVDNPKDDLTEEEVSAAMNEIILKKIFSSSGRDLVAIAGARIVTTNVQELNIA
ncbi:Protein of unknown function [Caloranaerobacter azorensis DSM 13643]|uniref:DUF2922 domain-containing protein n=1 Tax=Caloranaerobacter azorensis DSM 13643 TaxID=1121264 RepID=A0A1M5W185_9FIRM|nr:DUF2922 domain-containing protein [Caloranaerobacter azorensis]SHH80974.1 Protein of unknown function [Caloranaerobacter azorensis DSM 13643]